MPPRLLPKDEYHYVDTLHTGKAASSESPRRVSGVEMQTSRCREERELIHDLRRRTCLAVWTTNKFQNQLAAFPS
jgi:hypothetical protein